MSTRHARRAKMIGLCIGTMLFAACAGGGQNGASRSSGFVPSSISRQNTPRNAAGSLKVLYDFPPGTGTDPFGAPVFDAQGDIFSSTEGGGGKTRHGYSLGTVYELKASQSGYVHSELHRFTPESILGKSPGPIHMDAAGNIWGIASKGVFEIPPSHVARLIFPCQTNYFHIFYGVTIVGTTIYGVCGDAVFKLTGSGTSYTETTLYKFRPYYNANGDLAVDSSGGVYGTTRYGSSWGQVYKLTTSGSTYSYRVLHTFGGGNDGYYPESGLYIDPTGALIGTTLQGGDDNGTVYALRPDGSGGYTETIIAQGTKIDQPYGTPVEDSAGGIYITALLGNFYGEVVKLVPNGPGYTQDVLHNFGGTPQYLGTLSLDSSGAVYGNIVGGPVEGGIIFKISQ